MRFLAALMQKMHQCPAAVICVRIHMKTNSYLFDVFMVVLFISSDLQRSSACTDAQPPVMAFLQGCLSPFVEQGVKPKACGGAGQRPSVALPAAFRPEFAANRHMRGVPGGSLRQIPALFAA